MLIQAKKFKVLTYPKLDDKTLDKKILKTFTIKKDVLDIVKEHHDTHEELFDRL
jgi:hypothetical protein